MKVQPPLALAMRLVFVLVVGAILLAGCVAEAEPYCPEGDILEKQYVCNNYKGPCDDTFYDWEGFDCSKGCSVYQCISPNGARSERIQTEGIPEDG